MNFLKGLYDLLLDALGKKKHLAEFEALINIFRTPVPLGIEEVDQIEEILKRMVRDKEEVARRFRLIRAAMRRKKETETAVVSGPQARYNMFIADEFRKMERPAIGRDRDVSYGVNGNIVYGDVGSDEEVTYFNRENIEALNSMPFRKKRCAFDCKDTGCESCIEARLRKELAVKMRLEEEMRAAERPKRRRLENDGKVVNELNEKLGCPLLIARSLADDRFSLDDLASEDREEFIAWREKNKEMAKLINKDMFRQPYGNNQGSILIDNGNLSGKSVGAGRQNIIHPTAAFGLEEESTEKKQRQCLYEKPGQNWATVEQPTQLSFGLPEQQIVENTVKNPFALDQSAVSNAQPTTVSIVQPTMVSIVQPTTLSNAQPIVESTVKNPFAIDKPTTLFTGQQTTDPFTKQSAPLQIQKSENAFTLKDGPAFSLDNPFQQKDSKEPKPAVNNDIELIETTNEPPAEKPGKSGASLNETATSPIGTIVTGLTAPSPVATGFASSIKPTDLPLKNAVTGIEVKNAQPSMVNPFSPSALNTSNAVSEGGKQLSMLGNVLPVVGTSTDAPIIPSSISNPFSYTNNGINNPSSELSTKESTTVNPGLNATTNSNPAASTAFTNPFQSNAPGIQQSTTLFPASSSSAGITNPQSTFAGLSNPLQPFGQQMAVNSNTLPSSTANTFGNPFAKGETAFSNTPIQLTTPSIAQPTPLGSFNPFAATNTTQPISQAPAASSLTNSTLAPAPNSSGFPPAQIHNPFAPAPTGSETGQEQTSAPIFNPFKNPDFNPFGNIFQNNGAAGNEGSSMFNNSDNPGEVRNRRAKRRRE